MSVASYRMMEVYFALPTTHIDERLDTEIHIMINELRCYPLDCHGNENDCRTCPYIGMDNCADFGRYMHHEIKSPLLPIKNVGELQNQYIEDIPF